MNSAGRANTTISMCFFSDVDSGVMPDLTLHSTIDDLPEVPADRQAILPMQPHDFVESEFPQGKGHCDLCGGGPLAAIHTHVDPLERIATALEGLAPALERIANILAIGDRP